MKLYELLKEYGIPAKEAKQRLANKQVKINGEITGGEFRLGNVTDVYDQGFFLEELYSKTDYSKYSKQIIFFGLENLFGSNIENEVVDFLADYKMIEIAKENVIFLKIDKGIQKTRLNVTYHIESESNFDREYEMPKEIDESDILNKLKSDLEKVETQLSNKGFVDNAPSFKVEAARKRLENIKSKIDERTKNEKVYSFERFNKLK